MNNLSKENNRYQIIGKAFLENDFLECAILIEDERIKKISRIEFNDAKPIRFGSGHLILPAGIDLHVHFRDWFQSYKETIETGSKAAIAGGITTVLDMPNTNPPINKLELLKKRFEDFKKKSFVDFGLHSKPLDPKEIEEARNFAFGFKFYEEDLYSLPNNVDFLKKDRLVFHAQFGQDEVSAVEFVLKYTNNCENVRIAHVSRKESIRLINNARKQNRRIYIEVTPHHTFLSREDARNDKAILSVRPPLSTREDNIAIIQSINNGLVDFIATDHAPHSIEEKLSENPPPGYPSLEIVIPIFLTFALKGILDIRKVISCFTSNPAKYLKINKGVIKEGYYADITVVNTNNFFKIDPTKFISMSKFSPFSGWEVCCKPVMTILRGNIVYVNGDFLANKPNPKSIFELA